MPDSLVMLTLKARFHPVATCSHCRRKPLTRAGMLFRIAVLLAAVLLVNNAAIAGDSAAAQMPPPAETTAASAGANIDEIINLLAATHRFTQVSISSDGKRVAWVEMLVRESGMSASNYAIFMADLNPASEPRRISAGRGGDFTERDIAWSPDSSKLAFVSDAAKRNQRQLYVLNLAGGTPRQLTRITGHLSSPRWSPDGKSLAVLFIANAPRVAGPLEPMTPDSGVVESQ